MADEQRVVLKMICACGARLYVDCGPRWASDAHSWVELAKAWNAAHRAHHVEPKPENVND